MTILFTIGYYLAGIVAWIVLWQGLHYWFFNEFLTPGDFVKQIKKHDQGDKKREVLFSLLVFGLIVFGVMFLVALFRLFVPIR